MAAEASEVEAARNSPPPVSQLRTQAEKMAFLVRTIQGMEKNIQEIMQNQKSLERVVETKIHNMDMKYDSGDDVYKGNVASFTAKEVQKIKAKGVASFCCKFKKWHCP
ncbi:hypothetical protein D1007_53566 [Hordeum vulgare]|nr:hypothetical protein D1007_53566 [Hordeum vulgare]